MVRPRKCRRIGTYPDVTYFKPRGLPLGDLSEVSLPVEGLEALRLADRDGMTHEAAADAMRVSRQTFGRILADARHIVAEALTAGMALSIQGGDYVVDDQKPARKSLASIQWNASSDFSINGSMDDRKGRMMRKIAISSEGPGLDDALDPRFGRAAGFIVVDPDTFEYEYLDNGAGQSMVQGAGIKAAGMISDSGVEAVLTGYVGPKAFKALRSAHIKVGQKMENMTVRQAVEAFNSGHVDWARQPNRRGHGR